jgi:hypothetical protein
MASSGSSTAYKAGKTAGGAWESVKNFFGGNAAEPYAGEATKETFNDHAFSYTEKYCVFTRIESAVVRFGFARK